MRNIRKDKKIVMRGRISVERFPVTLDGDYQFFLRCPKVDPDWMPEIPAVIDEEGMFFTATAEPELLVNVGQYILTVFRWKDTPEQQVADFRVFNLVEESYRENDEYNTVDVVTLDLGELEIVSQQIAIMRDTVEKAYRITKEAAEMVPVIAEATMGAEEAAEHAETAAAEAKSAAKEAKNAAQAADEAVEELQELKNACSEATEGAKEASVLAVREVARLEEMRENGAFNGKPGEDGRDGIDGAPIFPVFTVDPHNMHLYLSERSNRFRVINGHLIIKTVTK